MEKRVKEFQRNMQLENTLHEINIDLEVAEQKLLKKKYKKYPIILVMGALRSGTTLTMQWLANTGEFSYPTNFISRFYKAPILGAKIQRMLCDPALNFRNEMMDIMQKVNYSSQNGKTQGVLAPNEFWYFWRRFLPYETLDVDYLPDSELLRMFDKETFINEVMGVADVFHKPFAMKGMIVNYNIGFLNKILDNVVFIYIKRDPYANIASVLEARKRQFGNEKTWYSFRIPEMERLLQYDDPAMQVAGQLYYINRAIENGLKDVAWERKLEITYEDFCKNPRKFYYLLAERLKEQGLSIAEQYCGEETFQITRTENNPKILKSYSAFMEGI